MTNAYPIPANERERLAALNEFRVVGSAPEEEFDHVAKLAAELFKVPTALITFVEKDRQSFKARVGFEASETSRDASFCAHTIVKDDVLVVPDACADDRFRNNPLVTAAPSIRFYAGAPLRTSDGHNIGSLCIIDSKPRPALTSDEEETLRRLALVTMDHLERRRLNDIKKAAFSLAAATPDAIVGIDDNGRIAFWNAGAAEMFGYTRREVLGKPSEMIVAPDSFADFRSLMSPSPKACSRSNHSVEMSGRSKTGGKFPIEASVAVWQENGQDQFGMIIRDISQRNAMQGHLRYLTSFDRLTDLPNRSRFLELIEEALQADMEFSVLKIGLDRLGEVNGSMGMAAGDAVLKQTADRIRESVGGDAVVARLGGDEFGVLLKHRGDAEETAASILRSLQEPFTVSGLVAYLGASIGGVLCNGPDDRFDDANAVLRAALLALHEAKLRGGQTYAQFRSTLSERADEQRRLADDIRRAFTAQEFELHYQPQIELATGRIIGAEALIRWRHPEKGLLSPAVFLPVLEISSIAVEVGRWILDTACAFAGELAASGFPVRMGVNLFAAQFRDKSLIDNVKRALSDNALPAHLLELEITETTVLGVDADILQPLQALRAKGVGIAFDDYGTGFASLSLLKKYPLTRLKIDREFVRDIENDLDDAAIVEAVLAMGKSLRLEVIAEGMETQAQADILKQLGCAEAQGYLFGKPMPAADFSSRISRNLDVKAAEQISVKVRSLG